MHTLSLYFYFNLCKLIKIGIPIFTCENENIVRLEFEILSTYIKQKDR